MSDFPKPKDAQDAVYIEADPLSLEEWQQRLKAEAGKARREAPTKVEVPRAQPAAQHPPEAHGQHPSVKQHHPPRPAPTPAAAPAPRAATPSAPTRQSPARAPRHGPPQKPSGGFSLGSCITGGCLTIVLLVGTVVGLAWWNNRTDDDDAYPYAGRSQKSWTGVFYPMGNDLTQFISCAGYATSESQCIAQCNQAAADFCESNRCMDVDMECWPE